MLKIIFLDIDGVLNVIPTDRDEWGAIFQEPFVSNLRLLIKATGAKIVMSSSWRGSGIKEMQRMWKTRHLPGELIDVTPYANNKYLHITGTDKNIEDSSNAPRGIEIEWWLNNHGYKRFFVEDNTIQSYVILDDDTDMLFNHRNNFVQTSDNWKHPDAVEGLGFTTKCLQKAIKILNK